MIHHAWKTAQKAFSVLFALLLITLTIIPAFAEEEKITLSASNIVEYPSLLGEIYYSQTLETSSLSLTGGKVTVDGTPEGEEIPGHFEFLDPEYKAILAITCYIGLKFIPENEDLYAPIEIDETEKKFSVDVKEMPIEFADPTVVLTGSVTKVGMPIMLAGASYDKVDIVSGVTGEVVTDVKWSWTAPGAKITASGFYPIKISGQSSYTYETIETYVYLRIPGDESSVPAIRAFPTLEPITYHEGLTAKEVQIIGGDADGTFSAALPDQKLYPTAATSMSVLFTPNDGSASYSIGLPLEVAYASASFVDENGEEIVPVVSLEPGACSLGPIRNILSKESANVGTFTLGDIEIDGITLRNQMDSCSFDWQDTTDIYDATVKLKSQGSPYYTKTMQFQIAFVKQTVTPKISRLGDAYYVRSEGTYASGARYVVTVDGQTFSDIRNNNSFEWRPEKSGTYEFTISIDENTNTNNKIQLPDGAVTQSLNIVLTWEIKTENCTAAKCQYGETAVVQHSLGDQFGAWEFYDENGNKIEDPETELGMVYDPTVPYKVTFIMPDHEVTVKALDKNQALISGNNGNTCTFFKSILDWLIDLLQRLHKILVATANLVKVTG